jgi:hypothetical protein
MLELEFRWWIWLLIALIAYMATTGPHAVGYVLLGLVHAFTGSAHAIVRGINAVRTSH